MVGGGGFGVAERDFHPVAGIGSQADGLVGAKCPAVGIGTFMLSPADAGNSVREALKMGDRLVDTAARKDRDASGPAFPLTLRTPQLVKCPP